MQYQLDYHELNDSTLVNTAMDKTLSIKVKRDRLRHGQSSTVCVSFHLLLSLLEMTSIKKKKLLISVIPILRRAILYTSSSLSISTWLQRLLLEKVLMTGWPVPTSSSYPFFISLKNTENFQIISTI